MTGEFVGIMTKIENIYKNQTANYSYLFTTTSHLGPNTFEKKAGNYYLAARLSENSNVDEGLELLDNPITTDTSWTTDFMYRIKGKEYLGNSW